MKFFEIHPDQNRAIIFHRVVARSWEFHRWKANNGSFPPLLLGDYPGLLRSATNNVSFQSVKFPSSGDTMVKSYGPVLVGMYFEKFRKIFGVILGCLFWCTNVGHRDLRI